MPNMVDLGTLVSQGIEIIGEDAAGRAGQSVSRAGDVNGDGLDDVIIGTQGGSAYVVYGAESGLRDIDLENLPPSEGFQISTGAYDLFITDVSAAGDVNGDGFDDVLVGGSFIYGWYGPFDEAWVIFGSGQEHGTVNLTELYSGGGFQLWGPYAGNLDGLIVGAAGDVNGDGFADIIVGAPNAGGSDGAAYVIFGKANGLASLSLLDMTPTQGFKILGKPNGDESTGMSVSGAGDINGDGYDDLIIGAPFGDAGGLDAGQAYVIFGKATGFGTIDLSNLAASAGFVVQGDAAGDHAGFSVSAAGDVNNDGYDDIIVGAPDANNTHQLGGEAYVIFGKAGGFGTVLLSGLTASTGFVIYGAAAADHAGFSVSGAGDVNNDGYDDIIIGAPGNDNLRNGAATTDAGEAYVIYGRAGGFGPIDLSNLSSAAGFIVQGSAANDQAGFSVSGAGDVDGDGSDDLIIGAPFNDRGAINAGAAYVISGQLDFLVDLSVSGSGDFNNDGRDDVLWRNNFGTVTDWLGQNDGGFVGNGGNAYVPAGTDWHVMGIGDFNGDHQDDVLWRNDGGTVTYWFGQGEGGFIGNGNVYVTLSNDWNIVGTGDFNGDGRDDVLWRSESGVVTDWLGQANGTFSANSGSVNNPAGLDWHILGTGDFNGDGRDDVLWRNDGGTITTWLGQPDGGFIGNGSLYATVSNEWHVVGAGDFNGDGRDDILWRNDDGTVTDWLGQANGTFSINTGSAFNASGLDWNIVGIGDYNGDGRDDVLWRHDTGTVTDWLGQHDGGFVGNGQSLYHPVSNDWHVQPQDSFWV